MKPFVIQTGLENHILRTKSTPVSLSEIRHLRDIAKGMIQYLRNPENHGVGLAAPQIGINKRFIAVSLLRDYDDEEYVTIVMFNPVIVGHTDESVIDTEGCLSLPGMEGHVKRHHSITLKFIDAYGKAHKRVLS
jgi:peptide deformylase